MIDTHSHIYSEDFDTDRSESIQRAKEVGVEHIILPNCDSGTLPHMLALEAEYPGYCHAAIGLHPTSVKENYREELAMLKSELERRKWIAVGEIGIDYHYDFAPKEVQKETFRTQLKLAKKLNLPAPWIFRVSENLKSLSGKRQILSRLEKQGLTNG